MINKELVTFSYVMSSKFYQMMRGCSTTSADFRRWSISFDVSLVSLESFDPSLTIFDGFCPQIPNAIGHGHVETELVLIVRKICHFIYSLQTALSTFNRDRVAIWLNQPNLAFLDAVCQKYDSLAIFWPLLNVEENSTF